MAQPLRAYHCMIEEYEVYIGKDARSNEYLSLKYSQANDYWFHVRGSAGSHVILCCHDSKLAPGKEVIKKIAGAAAYHSKQKNGGTVSVIYTMAKYVRKAKGGGIGSVTVNKEKSVRVKPENIEELELVIL